MSTNQDQDRPDSASVPDEAGHRSGDEAATGWPDALEFLRRHWLLLASTAGFMLFISKLLMVSNGSTETAAVLLGESVSVEVLVWHVARLFPDLLPLATIGVLLMAVATQLPRWLRRRTS